MSNNPADGNADSQAQSSSSQNAKPVLIGKRVAVTLAGADGHDPHRLMAFHAHNAPFLKPWLPPPPDDFLTLKFWRRWSGQSLAAYRLGQEVRLAIRPLDKPQSAILGQINFSTIVRGAAQSCTVGYHLSQDAQGKGMMFEAMELALGYMFNEWGLHRITACYLPGNERSARMLERLGFEQEGVARSFLFIDGAWRDHVLTALINPAGIEPIPGAAL